MGNWGTKISDSDTYQDIYQSFFDLYNQGYQAAEVSSQIQKNFADFFNDVDDRNDSLFALAYAQWETKSLDAIVFKQVKDIIEDEKVIEIWKQLGVDSTTIEKRRNVMRKFLDQISTEKEKAKRRIKAKIDFREENILTLQSPDKKRVLIIGESYVNGVYHDTHATLSWPGAGSGIFTYYQQGKFVTARWVDEQTLEIKHDKYIDFKQKIEAFYFCGDQGKIIYIPL